MELSIAVNKNQNFVVQDVRRTKDKFEVKKDGKDLTKDDELESHFAGVKYYIRKNKEFDELSKEDARPNTQKIKGSKEEDIKVPLIRVTSKNDEEKTPVSPTGPKGLNFPITRIKKMSSTSNPLEGFVAPVDGQAIEHGEVETLPKYAMVGSKSYDLLVKAGYDPKNDESMGKLPPELTGEKVHGLNETQKMLKDRGYDIKSSHTGLAFALPPPVRIAIKRANNNYISEEEDFEGRDEKAYQLHKASRVVCQWRGKPNAILTEQEEKRFVELLHEF
ncbi:hypothetical protein LIER_30505 [Lithospermum erythrorhizon]|uniref:Uncharacterized protein n=1 Tax=Lithospermum erythrorhizon TaxID=34254 RepID=A0AAV3RPS4_LITER